MTLPASGPLSLSAIQTEFGGSNPIGLNEYYRGGSLVPNIAPNNNITTSGAINMGGFYNGTKASANPSWTTLNRATNTANPAPATSSFTFNTDGTITFSGGGTGSTTWAAPAPSTGIGSNFWVRFTPTAGTFSANSAAAFTQVTSAQTASVVQGIVGVKGCTFTITVAADAAGTTILATWTGNQVTATVT